MSLKGILPAQVDWADRHEIGIRQYSDGNWYAFQDAYDAWGESADEVLSKMAVNLEIPRWEEEGPK